MGPVRSTGFVDPGWEHGVAQDEKKKKVKCNYCGKIVSGGIYRLKQHLARVSGEVTYCNKAPEEVYFRMKENLEGGGSSSSHHHHHHHHRSTKKPPPIPIPTPIPRQSMDYYSNFDGDEEEEEREEEEEEEENVGYRGKGKRVATTMEDRRCLGYVDPGWEHCVAQDERKKKVKCNYCEKVVSGGINRFKQHLARIPGEVAPCKRAPERVFLEMKENMKWHRTGRKQRRAPSEDENEGEEFEEEEEEEDEGFRDLRRPAPKRSRLDSVFAAQTANKPPPKKSSRREVASAIWKFFYHAGVPLQAANSAYFHKMLELVGQSGLGGGIGLAPSQLVGSSDRSLEEEVSSLGDYLAELKAFWAFTGCSVLADSWRDVRGRVLINFLASGPNGVYFVSSVDATEAVDDAFGLFKLIDNVVEEIGEENVVQVVTRNTPSYKAAGKMLEDKRRNLFWTPCAADCINRMLEDFLKIRFVGECMEKGKKITKFIYNRLWLLNLMKSEFTEGKEILRPALTRPASSFATLQSLLDHRTGLRRLFQSSKWVSSRCSKTFPGKEVEKIVMNPAFWKRASFVARSAGPIIRVLEKLDGLSMPFVYREMCGAKLAMKSVHGDESGGPFLDAVESHWNSLFCHPIYMAAHFLNPSYRYQPDFVMHTEVVRGLNECIARLEPDTAKRISASMQLSDYNSAKADFGTELAIGTRTELDPAAWWQQHGISCLELQRIAVRVLSQTCSSIGCEHDWSVFDQMRGRGQNRISRKRLDDLAYVHYNLRLRERQQFRKRLTGSSTPLDIVLAENLLHDWIVDEDPLKHEEMLCQGMEANAYEDETIDYEDVNAIVAPLNFTSACSEEEDEDGDGQVNYFDDDLTD